MTSHPNSRNRTQAGAGAFEQLDQLLDDNPDAIVAAMNAQGLLVPIPEGVELRGQRRFPGASAMPFFVEDDRHEVVAAWIEARTQPVTSRNVRVISGADQAARLSFFDIRSEHGVHIIVLEVADPDDLLRATPGPEGRPRLIGHVQRDGSSVFLDVDDATTQILGWSRDQLCGRPTLEFLHPDDAEVAVEGWLAMRTAGSEDIRSTVRLRHRDGRYVWVEITNNNHLDDPDIGCVRSRIVDVTDQMVELEALHGREKLLRRLAEALPIGICHLRPSGEVMFTNPPLVELLGAVDSVGDLVAAVVPGDRERVQAAIDAAAFGLPADLEVGIGAGDGSGRFELTLRSMTADDGGIDGVVVCATDVTDRSRLRSELEHRANHDTLSGCLNRSATVASIERYLRSRDRVVVAYIDLDGFKAVNDRFGHAAGDEVLRVTAARLRRVIREHDKIGRIGGDEFAVIYPRGGASVDIDELADRLTNAIAGDVTFDHHRIPIRASVGAAISEEGQVDAEELLSRADAAMYEAKRTARDQDQLPLAKPSS